MKHIILDTDPGVDDAVAILLACASESIELHGVTTVGGNVGIDAVTANALAVLELAGRPDIPVYRGADRSLSRETQRKSLAHGDDGLGGCRPALSEDAKPSEIDAVTFLTTHVRENPGTITIVAIGPLTNIAAAIQADPSFAGNVKEVVLMGGAEGTGNVTPSAEFNFWHDPEAAEIVFTAGFASLTMVGLDATHQVFMTPGTRELVRQIGTPAAQFIHKITRLYTDFYWKRYREVGAELCDVLAIAYLIEPDLIQMVPAEVEIATTGICEGRSVVARTGRYVERTANAEVATKVQTRRFFELLLTTLFPADHADISRIVDHEYR
ncbi:nucleoside hydrolase [Specibacter sp. NPDC078709]|uniref:nucleoside hydrolase n=1 Tax=Specibacter sp. NPDC078709 TaxID=3154364 RepID=UPI00344A5E42